jgi:predicted permease
LSGGKPSAAAIAARVLKFPPFIALVLALASRGVVFPAPVDASLGRLADMLSPLALASVGWQLDLSSLRGHRRRMAVGLAYKLVLAPAMVLALLWLVHGALGVEERVAVVESAMAPMVTAGVLAAENRLEPVLASGMIALGVLASLVTVPLWWAITGAL